MPQGDKSSYSSKQKRMASHIERSAKRRGRGTKAAERIAWATVNKKTGGGHKRSSSSRHGTRPKSRSRKGMKSTRATKARKR